VIVSFHPLAERELNDAAQYYERESVGLGAAFLASDDPWLVWVRQAVKNSTEAGI
jgi:hypothetical protein